MAIAKRSTQASAAPERAPIETSQRREHGEENEETERGEAESAMQHSEKGWREIGIPGDSSRAKFNNEKRAGQRPRKRALMRPWERVGESALC